MMLKDHKDFTQLEAQIREEFTPLLTVKEVSNILSAGYRTVLDLVKEGKLDAYHISGTVVSREAVSYDTYGIRISPSSLRDHLESIRVK